LNRIAITVSYQATHCSILLAAQRSVLLARHELASANPEMIGDDAEDFARVTRADYGRWKRIIHEAGIAAE